ncbi:hypothetical protein [Actinoplanes awajinensis]
MAQGRSNAAIAQRLHLSGSAVAKLGQPRMRTAAGADFGRFLGGRWWWSV